jgi:hypothetical protein
VTAGRAFAIAAAFGVVGTAIALVVTSRKRDEQPAAPASGSKYPPGVSDSKGPWIYIDPWQVPPASPKPGGTWL